MPSQGESRHDAAATKLKQDYASSAPEGTIQTKSVRNSILAGSLAGIASTAVVYPFDVLRTKMQASAKLSAAKNWQGPLQVLYQTWQYGGIRAFYVGISLPLAAQALYKATVFSANEFCQTQILEWKASKLGKRGITPPEVTLTMADHFLCGFAGGAINAAAFVTPVEFVRNQLILHHARSTSHQIQYAKPISGPADVIRSTIGTSGILGLWRGIGMTVARDSLGCGCFFLAMTWSRKTLTKYNDIPPFSVTIISGIAAGLAFWAAALPLDTLKTWVQDGTSLSARGALSESIAKFGLLGTSRLLCRGWQMAFGRGAPSAAITICTYDLVYQKLLET